jgi:hypothetical protein
MNIKPGAYRTPLTAGLVVIGEDELAAKVADQSIKLAVKSSIQGAVVTRTDLKQVFIDALNTRFAKNAADDGVCDHYIKDIIGGRTVPVDNTPATQVDHYYAPGELFFRS